LSNCLFINGTKKMIQKKTVGQEIKNLSNQATTKLFIEGFSKIKIADTVELVQKDIITANIINLCFFTFIQKKCLFKLYSIKMK